MKGAKYKKVNLKPQKDRSVLNFHPWIFSGAINTNVKDFQEGEIVEVFDASDLCFRKFPFLNSGSIIFY
jgi:23S rRNA G2069 N7-methylase RlmK/C1962 C5-methylase RlmI